MEGQPVEEGDPAALEAKYASNVWMASELTASVQILNRGGIVDF